MPNRPFERVVSQPAVHRRMQSGINQMLDVVRPTLGPMPKMVAIERAARAGQPPELLDDGGIIARRIFELPDRDEDVGAMLARQVLWELHERVGDGTATAAVLMQCIFNEGVRCTAAGANAMRLREHLESGAHVILEQLTQMSTRVEGEEELAKVAETICHDRPLAEMLGEILDIVGEYGHLDLRAGNTRGFRREYVQGMFWDTGVFSRQMIADRPDRKVEMQNAAVVVSDLHIEDQHQLVPLLEAVGRAHISRLLITASRLSDDAAALLIRTSKDSGKFQAVAVKLPGAVAGADDRGTMEDLAILTGAQPVIRLAGDSLEGFSVEKLGRARRAWADRFHFGIAGGSGDPRALREHIAALRTLFATLEDRKEREKLRKRIGRLMGGSATLWVGGDSEVDIERRKQLAERTSAALREAIRGGVVPGGGVALLACRPALQEKLDRSKDADEKAAYRILTRAMEEPIRTILTNAGYDPGASMAEVELAGPGHGFDVRSGEVVDALDAGMLDSTGVVTAGVQSAIRGAALALTVDVLIHHKKPLQSKEP
jgi:chaperonin GroEL